MNAQSGASLLEVLAVLAVIGLGLGVVLVNFSPLEQPVVVGARLVESYLLQARSTSIATTSVHRVTAAADGRLITDRGSDCDGTTWQSTGELELPDGVTILESGWSVCFSRRGIADANVLLTVAHPDHGRRQVEVMLGGMTRII